MHIQLDDIWDNTLLSELCNCNIRSSKVDLATVKLVYNAWSEALRLGGNVDSFLFIVFAVRGNMDDTALLDIQRFVIDIDPDLLREMDMTSQSIHLHCMR